MESTTQVDIDERIKDEVAAVFGTEGLSLPDSESTETIDLEKLPGFGMWAGRDDLKDPSEWVRNLRKPRAPLQPAGTWKRFLQVI